MIYKLVYSVVVQFFCIYAKAITSRIHWIFFSSFVFLVHENAWPCDSLSNEIHNNNNSFDNVMWWCGLCCPSLTHPLPSLNFIHTWLSVSVFTILSFNDTLTCYVRHNRPLKMGNFAGGYTKLQSENTKSKSQMDFRRKKTIQKCQMRFFFSFFVSCVVAALNWCLAICDAGERRRRRQCRRTLKSCAREHMKHYKKTNDFVGGFWCWACG